MVYEKISELPSATTPLSGLELMEIVQGGVSKKVEQQYVGSGAGSTPFLPVTGTGTATGNIIGDLDGNSLIIQQGGQTLFLVDPIGESSLSSIFPLEDGSNVAGITLGVGETEAVLILRADYNSGENTARIDGYATAEQSYFTYTADSHTFNLPAEEGRFSVSNGTTNFIQINITDVNSSRLQNSDGISGAMVTLDGNTASASFSLFAYDAIFNSVSIWGFAADQTITLTASNGVIINNLTYPIVDGANNEVVTTDGAGNLFFGTPVASGTVAGAANQVGVFSGAGTVNGSNDFTWDGSVLLINGTIKTMAAQEWDLGAASAGVVVPDTKIRVTIEGVEYDIVAKVV